VAHFPVPYPTACSPQAWATAAPLVLLRAMLGLDARNGELTLDPVLPNAFGRVAVRGIGAFRSYWDVEATGRSGNVRRSARGHR
jgi:glycogen debranching enzyme